MHNTNIFLFFVVMVSYISADYVFPGNSSPIKDGVIGVNEEGLIIDVLTAEQAKELQIKDITHHKGLLVPGFVNTHCHLELSNLQGQIDSHTGLVNFIQNVIKLRTSDEYALNLAMLKADIEMFENGIVAVGDICNQIVSRMFKSNTPIYYHTFLEIMGFNPEVAKPAIDRALTFKEEFDNLPLSIVPHAPYSVSEALFNELRLNQVQNDSLVSIHNQETADENAFFKDKSGSFLELYNALGQDISHYEPSGKTSIQTYLPFLSPDLKTLLVHNTHTSKADVEFAESIHPHLYWCLCPGANLYIENQLPDIPMLWESGIRITLGTDSLASNSKLSIVEEMLIIQAHFNIPAEDLIKWGTWNGAEFLGVDDRFGSLEAGKIPGINILEFSLRPDGTVALGSFMKKLF